MFSPGQIVMVGNCNSSIGTAADSIVVITGLVFHPDNEAWISRLNFNILNIRNSYLSLVEKRDGNF
jgi:hypothetical protein